MSECFRRLFKSFQISLLSRPSKLPLIIHAQESKGRVAPPDRAIQSNFETREVSMKKSKHEPKPMMAARFQAEAREVLAKRSDKRSRFLDVALSNGSDFEPVGRLAG
ncbi:hypothetical protein BK674_01325 [Pseudomonas moraviensis]|uniref:Uncharacterized protein n=2 Tax=Pseudomonas TaxID=286 RepID=A0A423NXG1_9PSED|nr:hypothetical protein BK674_01325 [Pseudomonas moraviensis]